MKKARELALLTLVFCAWYIMLTIHIDSLEDLGLAIGFLLTAILIRLTSMYTDGKS